MQKLLLISIWVMTIILPFITALDPSPRRGLRRLILGMSGFIAFYVFSIVYILPRLPG